MDHDLEVFKKRFAELGGRIFLKPWAADKLPLHIAESESCGQAFASFLADLKDGLMKILADETTPELKAQYEETGDLSFTPSHGWHVPLFQSCLLTYLLELALSQNSSEEIAWNSFKLGRHVERAELQYQYELEIKKRENQKEALGKGNQTKKAGSQEKETKAVDELLRRITANPRASKTSHIEAMAKETDGVHLRWGSRATLIKWCKHVKSPSRNNGK